MKSRRMLSRGSLLAGVLCQVRDRQSSKQFVELVRSRSHSVPAIRRDFMEDGSEQPDLKKNHNANIEAFTIIARKLTEFCHTLLFGPVF